jgi:hypothetical protein
MPSLQHAKDLSPRWAKDVANGVTRGYALATVSQRPGPDFLVIGTKRGGTTSIWNYLLMHPGVLGLFPSTRGKKSTDFFFKEQHRGVRWYRSHFHTAQYRRLLERRLGYAPVGGEASPYYLWDPRIAAAARRVAPGVKAIVLLRDPVERAWSQYQERTQNGVEPLSFADALDAEPTRTEGELERMAADPHYYSEAHDWYSYRQRGVYLPQLENWTSVFPAEQLLVLRSEEMYSATQSTFDRVCDFLGIDRHPLPPGRTFNASHRKSSVPEPSAEELRSFYAPHNRALEEHLGESMQWPA